MQENLCKISSCPGQNLFPDDTDQGFQFLFGGIPAQGNPEGTVDHIGIYLHGIQHMAPVPLGAGAATFREDIQKEKQLLDRLVGELSQLDGVAINGCHEAPHILYLSIPGVPTQNTINILQDHGICVSAGSACAKGHRSHVLDAMKVAPEIIDGTFRISLCRDTTQEELDLLFEVIRDEILPRAR